ncbi:MAG TPA: hypothetical protein VLH19_02860 [Patescibacteria group bacterium]|nr:hypothetical protein [Patescibacteria group bacterium]
MLRVEGIDRNITEFKGERFVYKGREYGFTGGFHYLVEPQMYMGHISVQPSSVLFIEVEDKEAKKKHDVYVTASRVIDFLVDPIGFLTDTYVELK